jgi:glycosyltransferase involved in cell wall biosynthesis
VLATRYEGWANVLLEAMACGLPVITTDVGGNAGVVTSDRLGTLVPFGDSEALTAAIASGLAKFWDQKLIRDYAEQNSWDRRVAAVIDVFREVRQAVGANEPE